ncbi:MAG: hypothetical protein WBQ94_03585 [Terracidiphilus sp.]
MKSTRQTYKVSILLGAFGMEFQKTVAGRNGVLKVVTGYATKHDLKEFNAEQIVDSMLAFGFADWSRFAWEDRYSFHLLHVVA